jgi:hypothetical protein
MKKLAPRDSGPDRLGLSRKRTTAWQTSVFSESTLVLETYDEVAHVVIPKCIERIVAPTKLSREMSNSAISHQSILPVLGNTRNSRNIKPPARPRRCHYYLKPTFLAR